MWTKQKCGHFCLVHNICLTEQQMKVAMWLNVLVNGKRNKLFREKNTILS